MKEDDISQLDDYDAPFCEQQYTHGSCYISLYQFKSFGQLIPPKLLQILDIYLPSYMFEALFYKRIEYRT